MSSVDSRGRPISMRSFYILAIIAAVSLAACSAEPQPESTETAAAEPSATTTTAPPTTSSAPATTAATTTTATTTTAPTTIAPSEPILLVVPAGVIPEIDGILTPGEWTEATIMPMSDGASLYLQHTDETL